MVHVATKLQNNHENGFRSCDQATAWMAATGRTRALELSGIARLSGLARHQTAVQTDGFGRDLGYFAAADWHAGFRRPVGQSRAIRVRRAELQPVCSCGPHPL